MTLRYYAFEPDNIERCQLTTLLELRALTKSVPGGRMLFHNLSLSVAPSELVAIVGESGSGKSTLLNMAAGLDTYDAGQIFIGGEDLALLDDRGLTNLRRRRIGFVFQAFTSYLILRCVETWHCPLLLQRVTSAISPRAPTRCLMLLASAVGGMIMRAIYQAANCNASPSHVL